MNRIANGDQSAIATLFGRYQLRIFRFIARRTGQDAVAEELTNEVFLDVWRQAGRFEGRAQLSTWLLAIARNKAISHMRKRTEDGADEEMMNAVADDADTPEVSAQKGDKADAIRQCMSRLSANHREIIDLAYYHELSITEIAEVTGIAANTVKTRMFHARKNLSALLAEAGIDRGWP